MARYFNLDGKTLDFVTRAEISNRIEYFRDQVLGGSRDKVAWGAVRVTPQLTFEYDMAGARLLHYIVGTANPGLNSTPTTMAVSDPLELGTLSVTVDSDNACIKNAKIDSWELTAEAGQPVKCQAVAIGKDLDYATAASAYTPDWANMPFMLSNVAVTNATLGTGSSITFTRFNLRLNNNLEPIFKSSTFATTIRCTGLDIEGRIRSDDFGMIDNFTDGGVVSCSISNAAAGGQTIVIDLFNCKFFEVPPSVEGFNIPETEIGFYAFQSGANDAIRAKVVGGTIKY